MPALDGAVVEVRRSDEALRPGDAGYATTLQLYWLGSGCHLIQLGGTAVLTDPFVTNEFDPLGGLRSDPARVDATLARIPVPSAVLINHSHHDHILDAHAAMSLPEWENRSVPLYGGQSAVNILAGFRGGAIEPRWHAVRHRQQFAVAAGPGGRPATVTAFQSEHPPHLKCGFTLADGIVAHPRTTPPRRLRHFQAGEVFNYLIELRGPSGVTFNVFYLGAPAPLDEHLECLPPAGTCIDVAIILAPTADNVRGYPEEHLAVMKPRHVVLSHFNTFFKDDPDQQLTLAGVDFVKMPKLSRDVQATFARNAATYPKFERLHIPAITVVGEAGTTRNVTRLR
jgi:L-ascorbate metabolism protein UlaG (beta-lactamase superfamily)